MRTIGLVWLLAGCGGGAVTSDEEAELAYVGLDAAVSRALKLGLQGFAAASSANIDPQSEPGDVSGTMTVSGQVDQGASDNKGLRLDVSLEDYQDVEDLDDDQDDDDDLAVQYHTETPLTVDLQLKDMPDGTLEGTFGGVAMLVGSIEGELTLNLSLSGPIEEDPATPGFPRRVEGGTAVTGTVTNDGGGEYQVDVVL